MAVPSEDQAQKALKGEQNRECLKQQGLMILHGKERLKADAARTRVASRNVPSHLRQRNSKERLHVGQLTGAAERWQ